MFQALALLQNELRNCGLCVCLHGQKMELRYWWEHGKEENKNKLVE